MLVSKAQFIYYVNKYKEAREEQEQFQSALRPFFDFPICKYLDDLVVAYESLLVSVSECYDEDAIFSWWISKTQGDNKLITVQHQPYADITAYDVETAEGLYNYLYDMYHKEA